MTVQEQMAEMFAAVDNEGRRFILMMLQGEYDRVQESRRSALRLIIGGQLDNDRVLELRTDEVEFSANDHETSEGDGLHLVSAPKQMVKQFPYIRPVLSLVKVQEEGGSYGF